MAPTRTARLVIALLGFLPSAPVCAQVCDAFPSLRDRHFRVAANAASYTYATELGASVAAGNAIYGVIAVGRTQNSDLDASTFDVRLQAGVDVPLGRAHRVFLCPVVAYWRSYGPNDFLLTHEDYRYTTRGLGLGLATVAAQARRLTVLLSGGLRVSGLTTSRTGWPTVNNTYRLWTFGVGLVLDGMLTVRPSMTIPSGFVPPGTPTDYAVPFGREEGEVSLGISVAVNLGRRSPSSD